MGFGREEDLHCEILSNGEIQFFGDPLDNPVLTLRPADWETVKFMAAHLEHYFNFPEEAQPDAEPQTEEPKPGESEPALVVNIRGSAVAEKAKQLALK